MYFFYYQGEIYVNAVTERKNVPRGEGPRGGAGVTGVTGRRTGNCMKMLLSGGGEKGRELGGGQRGGIGAGMVAVVQMLLLASLYTIIATLHLAQRRAAQTHVIDNFIAAIFLLFDCYYSSWRNNRPSYSPQ